ncbi:hypothetical protein HO173_012118 [Letharia columbiana]|uniref:Uncharacterized protein n=1 Tax=Letharia columbiana TaxID=112416 RepID=A0A8H6CQE7_9LECA|nr:uncharacterized protein HO173_012118 [Letharia columbiana]KAF6227589.1 hypothetical protein HO173_012118 [Letharia columbiana]
MGLVKASVETLNDFEKEWISQKTIEPQIQILQQFESPKKVSQLSLERQELLGRLTAAEVRAITK